MQRTRELETILLHHAIHWRDESRFDHVMLWLALYAFPESAAKAFLDSSP